VLGVMNPQALLSKPLVGPYDLSLELQKSTEDDNSPKSLKNSSRSWKTMISMKKISTSSSSSNMKTKTVQSLRPQEITLPMLLTSPLMTMRLILSILMVL